MKNIFTDITWRLHSFKQNIHNLIKWFPLVWRDRDWDFSFTYDAIQFKLEQQAKHLAKQNTFVNTPRYVSRANTMVELVKRCRNDYYATEYFDYFDMSWEFIDVPDQPNMSSLDTHVLSDDFDLYFAKYPRVYKQVLAGKIDLLNDFTPPTDKKTIAMYIATYNQIHCRQVLFKMLERHLENLWY